MTAKILDIGVDLGFLNNRLNIQFDYFRRVRDGIPEPRYDVLIPNEAGFSLPKENLKSDMHRGFDASIMWTDQINDFNYSVGGNITYSRFGIGNNISRALVILGMNTVTAFGIV